MTFDTRPKQITITPEELAFKQWLMGFDKNRDGRISQRELRDAMREKGKYLLPRWYHASQGMRAADANRDGFLDDNEMGAIFEYCKREFGWIFT